MPHELPKLEYDYDALEPHIDARTMEIHHTKHHQGYIDKLNKALENYEELKSKPVDELLRNINAVPEEIRQAVINNGGGHANHSLFWQVMSPKAQNPSGAVADAILEAFGDVESFKKEFSEKAASVFGSGWAWLVVDNGNLAITTTPNQNSPLMEGKTPILGLDVWEHAYYLKYQNKRPDYVQSWWNLVNWEKVEENYKKAME